MRSFVDRNNNVVVAENIHAAGPFLDTFITDGLLVSRSIRKRSVEVRIEKVDPLGSLVIGAI